MGKGTSQNCVWPSVLTVNVEGEKASFREIRERESGRREAGKEEQNEGTERAISKIVGRSWPSRKVRRAFKEILEKNLIYFLFDNKLIFFI